MNIALLKIGFIILAFLTVVFVKLSVGLPIRSLLAIGMLGFIYWQFKDTLERALDDGRGVLLVTSYLAFFGVLITLANGAAPAGVIRSLIEGYIQPVIVFLVVYSVCIVAGFRFVSLVLISIICLSCLFSALQFIAFEPAWTVREVISALQGDDSLAEGRWRAMGLSFGPVHLGYQVCLVFSLAMIWSRVKGTPVYALLAIALIVVSSITSGNRSPILGAMLASGIFMFVYYRRLTIMVGPLLLIGGLLSLQFLMGALEEAGVRAARTDDTSAAGRQPLALLGILLFLHNPLGYGWEYDSKELWRPFWDMLKAFENSVVVQHYGLHNYFLNMLGKYGIFLAPLVLIVRMRWSTLTFCAWCFSAYCVNALFHNEGPFHAETFVWFVIPVFVYYFSTLQRSAMYDGADTQTRSPEVAA